MNKLSLLLTSLVFSSAITANAKSDLQFDVYNADDKSFNVNSTLIYGENDAILIDTGFTKADALRITAKVLDSGKELKTIFISQADPDYYFGAEVIHDFFPDANIITTKAVRKVIEKKLETKLSVWSPRMGFNAPVKPIIPEVYDKSFLTLEGHKIEIKGTQGALAHRPYLWIPDNKTVLGNVAIYGNMHLWMADTQTDASQSAWVAQLEEMQSLKPTSVIPGHMKTGTELNSTSIAYSLQYIEDFKQAKAESENSAELIEKMLAKYPANNVPISLSIGAKVQMGEMKW